MGKSEYTVLYPNSNHPLFPRICWTDVDGGTITTSLPGTTTTYHNPATTTLTYVSWVFEGVEKRGEAGHREQTTIFEVDQCTETLTASVTSTVRETVATITATATEYAATAIVTAIQTCTDEECY